MYVKSVHDLYFLWSNDHTTKAVATTVQWVFLGHLNDDRPVCILDSLDSVALKKPDWRLPCTLGIQFYDVNVYELHIIKSTRAEIAEPGERTPVKSKSRQQE